MLGLDAAAGLQAVDIEREGPGIIERLPQALFKAVARNAVPDDLERDVNALAEWLEPQVRFQTS